MAKREVYPPPPSSQPDRFPSDADQMQSEEVVMDCLTMLAASVHLDTAIDSFLETLGCFYGAGKVFLFHAHNAASTVSCAFSWPSPSCCTTDVSAVPGFEDWFAAFELEGSLRLWANDPRLAPLQPFCGAQPTSAIAVPLYTDTTLSGFLCAVDPTQHLSDMKVMLAVASLSVVELQKLDLMEQLDYLHHKDPLTDVYNRFSYVSSLAKSYHPAPATMGVVIASVNGLKAVNAVLGNTFGDSVVQQTAEIMKATLNADIYRIGGDEFLSLHTDLSAESFQTMVASLSAAFADDEICDVSIGTAWADHDIDIYELITAADQQLMAKKKPL